MDRESAICLVPAKGRSERLPGKNMRPLGGRPLLGYTLDCARSSGLFSRLEVSTDDPATAAFAVANGAQPAPLRPPELAADSAGVAEVCLQVLARLAVGGTALPGVTCILLPTSPFRSPDLLRRAFDLFRSRPDCPMLMSVTPCGHPPWWSYTSAPDGTLHHLFPEQAGLRRQALPPAWHADGAVMLLDTVAFMARGNYRFPAILPLPTPELEALDINTPLDFAFAEFLLKDGRVPHLAAR